MSALLLAVSALFRCIACVRLPAVDDVGLAALVGGGRSRFGREWTRAVLDWLLRSTPALASPD